MSIENEVVTQVDGVKTTLPAAELADLTPKVETPTEAKTEEVKPAEPKTEEPKTPVAPIEPAPKEPEAPKAKAKPIAKLLEKAHDAETRAEAAEKRAQELEAKLSEVAAKPASPQASADLKAIAEKYNIAEEVLTEIAAAARAGLKSPEIPKEIYDLIEQRKQEQEQQAEISAFDARVSRLATVFKDEPIKEQRDKLLELAYSTEKAPDGEPYFQKELSELYFQFIKPLVEPGKKSAEPSRSGSGEASVVLDFAEIQNDPVAIEKMSDEQFNEFSKWMQKTQKGSPMQRAK